MPARVHRFSADHPAAPGHFPGNPIIPGALLLAEVLRSVEIGLGGPASPCRIKAAKFLAPVRPGDQVVIDCSTGASDGTVRFRCVVEEREVLRGEVSCRSASRRD
jgi:3-hydroxyacyl-[acyl-carrier-protein] dehydratase